ncbi:cytochrome P450 [Gymnopus androsaceus JB14]|uniref:Cytochrome P450 n=1 Tax=Gymnopus androsaceus JB14 TaxID=1447944 RepID=A0A6A4HR96_9AGAR|nr:cytochrome P450 [Gymnopus androsaceus JB14]
MLANIPPGIPFLVKRLPQLLFPPAVAFVLLHFARAAGYELSTWIATIFYIFSFPVVFTISLMYAAIDNRLAAARDGMEGRLNTIGPTFNPKLLFRDMLFTFEPSHIKALLATQARGFRKRCVSMFNSLLGSGVFAVDVDDSDASCRFHRSITRPFFTKDRVTHFDIFDRHADDAIAKMKARFKARMRCRFPGMCNDVVSRFTLDSATEFLFGHSIGTLSDPLPYPSSHTGTINFTTQTETFSARISRAFTDAQVATSRRGHLGAMWPLMEFWKDDVKETMQPVHEFLEPIMKEGVRRAKEAKSAQSEESKMGLAEEHETLLDHLMEYTDDPILLRDEILNLAVAGRDTTASLLTFTVYMLSQHPQILSRLREEILTAIGPSRRPTYDDLRDMKYLRAVLNETLRLYPPVQSNKRTTFPPIKPGDKPIFIPSGTVYALVTYWITLYSHRLFRCIYTVSVMHRREDLWGPDASTFDPDSISLRNPFIFLPFNAGPRICLGQQFAYNESSFFIVKLLQKFDTIDFQVNQTSLNSSTPSLDSTSAAAGSEKVADKVQIKSHLTMYIADGLWLKMGESAAEDI